MDSFQALTKADEVRTFPSIDMPAPVFKVGNSKRRLKKTAKGSGIFEDTVNRGQSDDKFALPGLLKTRKTKIIQDETSLRNIEDTAGVFTGFNSNHLKLDMGKSIHPAYQQGNNLKINTEAANMHKHGMTTVDLSSQAGSLSPTSGSTRIATTNKNETANTLEELRNYIMLMDQYSLHNFMIYDGRTLKDTPEFQSFKRTYQHKWGAIISIINQLEDILTRFEVKLAIINGPRVFELSKLSLATMSKKEIYSCITNIDQIEMFIDSNTEFTKKQIVRVVIKLQGFIRMRMAVRAYRIFRKKIECAVKIESLVRSFIMRRRVQKMNKESAATAHREWTVQQNKLESWWSEKNEITQSDRSRTYVIIPSISVAEYLRMDFESFHAMQNTLVSLFYILADPDVRIVYVTPFQVTDYQLIYYEKFLSLLGISMLPKRLFFVTPEMINHLPQHLSLANCLWCSPMAMRRVRNFTKKTKMVIYLPFVIGWVEKRLTRSFKLCLLGPEPGIAETIQSRSFLKRFFMDTSVNIPIGSHDIFSYDDILIALSRLIASNLGVGRWIIRLNFDFNNESCVILDVEKMPLIVSLRAEQNELIGEGENVGPWFTRPIQLSVRKRIISALKKDFLGRIILCRKDIYPTWDYYLRMVKQYGCVIEAEPIERLGRIETCCFVDPFGECTSCQGLELIYDENYQTQAYLYPQSLTPTSALEGATKAITARLFKIYHVIGYVTVQFISFWDAYDQIPRLWAIGLNLGIKPVYGALGTTAIATNGVDSSEPFPLSLSLEVPEGRYMLYLPMILHEPLRDSNDESFFKLCRMRGIAFDLKRRVGSLFFLLDSVVGGSISLLNIGASRRKSIELAILTLSVIFREFGMDHSAVTPEGVKRGECLTNILLNLKKFLKYDRDSSS